MHPLDNFDNLSCYEVYVLSKMQNDSMVWFYQKSYIFSIKSIFVELYICVSTHFDIAAVSTEYIYIYVAVAYSDSKSK